MHAQEQRIPTITASISFETKQLGPATYTRWCCASCHPQRVGTWLVSSEKCAENAAVHAQWHKEGCK